jgi:hypothetical protein
MNADERRSDKPSELGVSLERAWRTHCVSASVSAFICVVLKTAARVAFLGVAEGHEWFIGGQFNEVRWNPELSNTFIGRR